LQTATPLRSRTEGATFGPVHGLPFGGGCRSAAHGSICRSVDSLVGSAAVAVVAEVGHAVGPGGVPPLDQGADSAGRQAELGGNLGRVEQVIGPSEEPDGLPVGLFDPRPAGP
jgi:hypothetical protein